MIAEKRLSANTGQIIKSVLKLSIPAVMAEVTSIVMQYIDAAMVGSMGAEPSAAIGLVSTTTWLIGGLCISIAMGFSVQVAQLVGAKREDEARSVFKQGLIVAEILAVILAVISLSICQPLPRWLGGEPEVLNDASLYFLIFSFGLPFAQLRQLSGSMLQCSGDMKTPSILNISMCVLDVIFNFIFIFPSRTYFGIPLYGANMGVAGAALGTELSEAVIALLMFCMAARRSKVLSFRKGGSWQIKSKCMKAAARIAVPAAFEHSIMCGAYVASTAIVAPLGTKSIAANSLAVTAESFCYMPGYGIGSAATTLVGQKIGAGKRDEAKHYAYIAVALGIAVMSVTAVLMFFLAPYLFMILTSSEEVRIAGTEVLRIECFAEPLYAASIVCSGAMRGAGDTLGPSIMSLVSIWGVRITSSMVLVNVFGLGLKGVWIAMCGELCFRGIIFLIRLLRGRWLKIQLQI